MKNLFAFFCFFLFLQSGFAQLPETFDNDLNSWTTNNPNSNWYHSTDGAAFSHNWDNRSPIVSITNNAMSGAAVFNGDSLSTTNPMPPTVFELTSPVYNVDGLTDEKPGLTFYQYFKNYEGNARVEVSADNGTNWTSFPVNQNVGNFMETLPNDFVFIDISTVMLSEPEMQVRFMYEGIGGFWIIDDIDLVSDVSLFTETYPPQLADTLCKYDYPFLTDDEGGAYIPNEVVVEYVDPTTAEERAAVREMFQITDFEYCECDTIELWKNPIVIEPTKVEITDSDFPNEGANFTFPAGFNAVYNDCISTNSYGFAFQMTDLCNSYDPNFFEHTDGGLGSSTMLAIRGGVGAGFTIPDVNLLPDSLYVLSFYSRVLTGTGFPDLEISVGGTPFDTVVVTTGGSAWGRYDVKLDIPTSGGGLISFSQLDAEGIYAIDDLYLSVYLLGDATIIDLNGIIEKTSTCAKVEEIDKNYYNFDFIDVATPPTVTPINFPTIDPLTTPYSNQKVIAVLDTGIDYEYDNNNGTNINLKEHLYYNQNNPCYLTDFVGHNFVDVLKAPYDDSRGGHGTHVAGIIEQNLRLNNFDSNNCDYKIMPVKTHDALGMGTLYRVSCGISYAAQRGANFINASWGYYGEEKEILENVIRNAGDGFDVMVVCSAGNDNIDIGIRNHWPSSLTLPKLITIAASTGGVSPALANFSNYSATHVHFGTLGENVDSSIPPQTLLSDASKSGTSMAAPRATAAALMTDCNCIPNEKEELIGILRTVAANETVDIGHVRYNYYFDTDDFVTDLINSNCLTTSPVSNYSLQPDLMLYPNPVTNELKLTAGFLNVENSTYQVVDITGKVKVTGIFSADTMTLDVHHFTKGTYYIQIIHQSSTWTLPFVKL
ncbi:MAG: hypothetical protein ACI85O_001881 [Saprospiraceae bacterium]|jgi:hypothetical protein